MTTVAPRRRSLAGMNGWKLGVLVLGVVAVVCSLPGCDPGNPQNPDLSEDSGSPHPDASDAGNPHDAHDGGDEVYVYGGTDASPEACDQPVFAYWNDLVVSAKVGDTVTLGMTIQVDKSVFGKTASIDVTSDDLAVVPPPDVSSFNPQLKDLAYTTGDTFTFTPQAKKIVTQLTLKCASPGKAVISLVSTDGTCPTPIPSTADVTCIAKTTSSPLACILPQYNETLKGIDDQGKVVSATGWGKGPGQAVTKLGQGAATVAAAAGSDDQPQPAIWLSNAFDPASAGPTQWTKRNPTGTASSDTFNDIAPYGAAGVVAASSTAGLYLFDGSTFKKGTSPDTAGHVACDGSGTCVAGATNGGILRSTNGLDWTSNGGNEVVGLVAYCNNVFVLWDVYNGQQLWSDDGGQTWHPGDLSAFNMQALACGNGIWVATAQGSTWFSTDQAKTWTQSADAVGPMAYSATAGAFFAATDNGGLAGIFKSTDGNNWTQTDTAGGSNYSIGCF